MILGPVLCAPLVAVAGTIYPAYRTYKAVASGEAEAMVRWMQYWMLFSMLSLVEAFADAVGAYLPFYYEGKLLLVLWLSADKFQGATFLCKKHVEPFLAAHQAAIDEQLDFLVSRAKNLKVEDMRSLVEWAQTKGGELAGGAAIASAKAAPAKAKAKPEQEDKPDEPEEVEVKEGYPVAEEKELKKDM